MKKIDPFLGVTPKLEGQGDIKYCLWVDSKGALYVQIVENSSSGTFSKCLFSVSKYLFLRNCTDKLSSLEGFDISTNKVIPVEGNNNGAFLKAILRNLLP